MPDKILPKRSYTAGRVPTTSDLAPNEIAINYADKVLYVNQAGTIVSVPLAGSGGSGGGSGGGVKLAVLLALQ